MAANYNSVQDFEKQDEDTERTKEEEENASIRDLESDQGEQTKKRSFIHLIAAVTTITCCFPLSSHVLNQWLYNHYVDEILGPNTTVNTRSHPCVNSSSSNMSEKALVETVQDNTSQTLLYLDLLAYGLAIPMNLIYGLAADRMSRRTILLIPACGFFIRNIIITCVIYFNLNLAWLYLACSLDGLSGSKTGLYLGTYLYTSDVTPRDYKRTLGMAMVESVKGIFEAIMEEVTGQLLQDTGYITPSVISTGVLFIVVVMMFLLPDMRPKTTHAKLELTPRALLGKITSPYTVGSPVKRRLVSLAAGAFFVNITMRFGVDKVRDLYMMNLPFCLSSSLIGWFMFARNLGAFLFTVISIATLSGRIPGMGLGILGVSSAFAGQIVYGVARTRAVLFTIPAIGIGEQVSNSVIRGETSRLLGPDKQGPLFASMAVIESICFTIGPPIFLSIYRNTQDLPTGTGTSFLFALVFMVWVLGLMIAYQVIWLKQRKEVPDTSVIPDEKDVLIG